MLHELLARLGVYYAKRQYMPRGIDWAWDVRRVVAPGTITMVVDVGANEGQTIRQIGEHFPGATVHAFEPVRSIFQRLQSSADPRRVHVNHLAVSNQTMQVHVRAAAQLSHLVSAEYSGSPDVETVEAVTLDAYCRQHGIAHIDILKTDTEGHDLEVLQGASGLLSAGAVDWILVEATFDRDDSTHSAFDPVHALLRDHGLTPWCFYDYLHVNRQLAFCNALFARR